MTLTNLAVKPTIDVDNFVVVKADIGSERVVADVSREAINDYFNQYILDDEEIIGLVESNIEALSMIIQENTDGEKFTLGISVVRPLRVSSLNLVTCVPAHALTTAACSSHVGRDTDSAFTRDPNQNTQHRLLLPPQHLVRDETG